MTEARSNRVFRAANALVVGGLVVAILVLSLLVTTSGPRVRHAVVQDPGEEGAVASVGQGITLVFDRPVEGENLDESVTVRPEVAHTVSQRDRQLSVAFEENLDSGTGYALTVKSDGVKDEAGKEMERLFRYEFTTVQPSFTYLERNPDSGEPDQVIERWPLTGESRTLYEADRIESFRRGGDRLAVVMPRGDDAADELRVIDLEGGGDARVDFPGNVKVEALALSPEGGQLAFATRANVGTGADEAYRKGYDGRLYRYDVAGGRLRVADTLGGGVEDVLYSRDGGTMLYRTLDGAYYLTGAAGKETIPLGKYDGSGGFDRTGARISFQNRDGAAIYDAESRRSRDLPGVGIDRGSSTPTFLNNSDALVYRESVPDPSTGESGSRVVVVNPAGEVKTRAESPPETYFFDAPILSPDDRHALVESASTSATIDGYLSNPQPKGATLMLYDLSSGQMMDEVRGVDPVWNR